MPDSCQKTRHDISDILQESMIPYHCDLCDTKFISKQLVFEVHQKENKPWIMRNSLRKHDSIPLHCEICDTKFILTAGFEILKTENKTVLQDNPMCLVIK